MKTVITGGTGLLGRVLLPFILDREEELMITSRHAPKEKALKEKWAHFDLESGAGMDTVVSGTHSILHLASDTKTWSAKVDVQGTERLVQAAREAGVKHFIYISIVGTDRVPLKYYRVKTRTEEVIRNSGIPYTILRATQFHPFVDQLLQQLLKFPIGLLPKKVQIQPVETEVVARRLYELYQEEPKHSILNIGGPEILEMGDMAKAWMRCRGTQKWILPLPLFGKYHRTLNWGVLTCPEEAPVSQTWEDWLEETYG